MSCCGLCSEQTDETVSHEGGRNRGMRKKGKGMSSSSRERGEVVGAGWHRCWGLGEGQGRKRKQNVCIISEMLSRKVSLLRMQNRRFLFPVSAETSTTVHCAVYEG